MRKAKLIPVYFETAYDASYRRQLECIRSGIGDLAQISEPRAIGQELPEDVDAVLVPVLVGEAYRHVQDFAAMNKPVLLLTSEFLTIDMWDWELRSFLANSGVEVLAPYSPEMTRTMVKTLGLLREMRQSKFLVYQETPGDGMQAEIFKRFFWWEDVCLNRIKDAWGIEIVKRSLKELGARAEAMEEEKLLPLLREEKELLGEVSEKAGMQALKLYQAISEDLAEIPDVAGVGTNCLNESFHCRTTPCLAWHLLFEKKRLLWACEADLLSLLTEYMIYQTIGTPVMMTNLYPFLMGMAAIRHEKMERFPEREDPQNCVLGVHCGYFGCMPRKFAKQYTLREKVLEIVPEEALAVDARYTEGPVTIVQLNQDMKRILLAEGKLEEYVGYEGTDCRNGAVIRVKDGYKLMKELFSHHAIIVPEHIGEKFSWAAQVLGLKIVEV